MSTKLTIADVKPNTSGEFFISDLALGYMEPEAFIGLDELIIYMRDIYHLTIEAWEEVDGITIKWRPFVDE